MDADHCACFWATMLICMGMTSSPRRAKLYWHQGAQCVQLPEEFRLPGAEVAISRTATGGIVLDPIDNDIEARKKRFLALAGSSPTIEDILPHITPDTHRDE